MTSSPTNGCRNTPETLFEFPCDFPLKILGDSNDDFVQVVSAIVLRHAPDFDASCMEMRTSSSGRYISLTCTIRAVSREQLDALYRELSGHPLVKVLL